MFKNFKLWLEERLLKYIFMDPNYVLRSNSDENFVQLVLI